MSRTLECEAAIIVAATGEGQQEFLLRSDLQRLPDRMLLVPWLI
tara:strand:- start:9755 stop:9886 length:132 start_codon:yes stop_codon:yes gene_type:complete